MHSAKIVKQEYMPWMKGWYRILKKGDLEIKIIKYEDLYEAPARVSFSISQFFELELTDRQIQDTADLIYEKRTSDNLSQRLAAGKKSTFRSGDMERGKSHFSEEGVREINLLLFRNDLDEIGYSD